MTHQNELPTNSSTPPNSFSITEPMLISLHQTKPWVRLLSILGFIFIGFIVIKGIVNMFVFFKASGETSFILIFVMGVINLLMGIFYFFPTLFLFKFSSSIGRLLNGGGVKEMEETLSNQKSFWKFSGILTLITLGFAILGIFAAIIIPQFVK